MTVTIELALRPDTELIEAFGRLLPLLSSTAPPTVEELAHLLNHDAANVLVARVDGRICGTLTLLLFPLLTGVRARIEDVVVDEAARGRGVGAALTEEAMRLAAEAGARSVDLTSRPSREAANRLYERLGFQVRDTRVLRFTPE